jgi:selenocysteine lyase/cysteine desulfurase
LNKISHYLPVLPGELVIFTRMEHHSNELPWRVGPHLCLGLRKGRIDLDELESILKKNQGKVKLVAVSGASNVTGYTPPIDIIAELAHRAGARIVVDAAQLIAHRPVNVLSVDHIRHLDFLAFSGHKMYAPFGSGVLIAPKSIFNTIPPSQVGGGTVKGIGPAGVIWATPPEVEEAGSPNVLGALTMARAAQILTGMGWSNLIRHETELLTFILSSLKKIPGVILYNEDLQDRVGVISFNLQRLHHQSVADYLAGWGIGVRSGCFCARGFVQDLLREKGDDPNESLKSGLNPGLVRVSMGCYNQMEELEVFIEVVKELSRMK